MTLVCGLCVITGKPLGALSAATQEKHNKNVTLFKVKLNNNRHVWMKAVRFWFGRHNFFCYRWQQEQIIVEMCTALKVYWRWSVQSDFFLYSVLRCPERWDNGTGVFCCHLISFLHYPCHYVYGPFVFHLSFFLAILLLAPLTIPSIESSYFASFASLLFTWLLFKWFIIFGFPLLRTQNLSNGVNWKSKIK